MELKIEYIAVDDLKPYEKNNKKHEDFDIGEIAKSISKYEMIDPVGIWGKDNTIVEGHGRVLACKQLGIDKVPCIRLDHLTDEQRREYAIVHNKSQELAEFNLFNLKSELSELDLSDFAFDFGLDPEEIEAEERQEEEEEENAVDKLPESRVLGFSISAFGTDSECFMEIKIDEENAECLLKRIKESGASAIADKIREAIKNV